MARFTFKLPKLGFSGRLLDWWLFLLPVLLAGIGVAMIASLTYGTERIQLAINQGIFAGVGIGVMLAISRIDYRSWRNWAFVVYILSLGLLVLVDVFGVTIFGATRWLTIGPFQLQPSELMKLALIMVLARWFSERTEFRARDLAGLAVWIGLPLIFLLRQPDLGTAVILLIIAFGLLVAGGVPRRILASIVGVGMITLPVMWQFLADYQQERIMTFFNPGADPYGAGYNVLQALIAVGSGGMFGQGLGQGSQSQLKFLPVAHTDFIFAGVAEATGLIGSLVLLALLMFLILRVIRVAQIARDQFGFLVSIGVVNLLLAQTVIHAAMNLGLLPVTGIPLPFVSHGGTALLTSFLAIGMLQSIVLRHKKITF